MMSRPRNLSRPPMISRIELPNVIGHAGFDGPANALIKRAAAKCP